MRIRRVHVESYGSLKDRRFEFGPGMTVIHGENESGKTTLMDFIRNTLVPTTKHVYPERRRTDSGSIVVDDGGEEKTVTLTQRARGGDVPECISSMEPDLYRSIYALNQGDLEDDKLLSSGELGQRFLTIPGSEGMMESMESISDEVNSLLGKTASSPSRIMKAESELAETESRIAALRESAESYGSLAEELESEKGKLAQVRKDSSGEREQRDLYLRYQSQRNNYRQLSAARRAREMFGQFIPVSQEQMDEFSRLSADRSTKRKICVETKNELQTQLSRLGTDPQTANDLSPRMERVVKEHALYESRKHAAAVPVKETHFVEKPNKALVALGLVILIAGLAGALVSSYTVVLAALGGVLAALGFLKKTREEVTVEKPLSENHADYLSSYEHEVLDIMKRLGRQHSTVDADLDVMNGVVEALRDYRSAETRHRIARQDYSESDVRAMRFISSYGNEEKFRQYRNMTSEAEKLDQQIAQCIRSISDAGLDPEKPECPVSDIQVDGSEEAAVSKRIGELEERMKSILDTDELDALMDRRASLTARRDAVLRRGAVMHLASVIAEQACGDIYSEVHPGVISTADRYLGMMTEGRYRFDLDPRNKGLAVRDGDGVKGIKQCSTGLRAQLLLSLKLAVARELADGEVPVILDDVLLPFDTRRKEGAVKALSEVSGEMQVIVFTCDDQTAELARSQPGVVLINL